MASIMTGIQLQDNFSSVLYNVCSAVNLALSSMTDLQGTMGAEMNMAALEGARSQIDSATAALNEMNEAMQNISPPPIPTPEPFQWQSNPLPVFTGTGMERFQQEAQSANAMLQQLSHTQDSIARQAFQTNLLSPEAFRDMNSLAVRVNNLRERIQAISENPLNMGTEQANNALEQLRAQLNNAILQQNDLNDAMERGDLSDINSAYLQLSQIVGDTERHIRDNTDEQGRFNHQIRDGISASNGLMSSIKGIVSAYAGVQGIRKAFAFVQDCTEAFNTQLNAENQLMAVLGNMLDEDYVAQFELETTADTTGAINEINAIQSSVDEVVIPVSAATNALQAEFDAITAKASEIQSKGIYGDEAMIAGAAEFATYFSDTDAITAMMDTLSDYAMGMSGGGEIDANSMVNYATSLGKIMTGSYDAMTKKGFEFTEAQKAIIEGSATQEQIAATLGQDYLAMSDEMQQAAAISQVIEESWGGLYETMSNTPEGQIIQMTNAWGDMKEVVGGQLYPYVLLFVDTITENWGTIQTVVDGITTGLEYLFVVLSWLLDGAINFVQFISDNWSVISPIVYGVAAALLMYLTYLGIVNAIEIVSTAIKMGMVIAEYAHAAATGTAVAATTAETAAQMGLNTALLACPITWIILGIIALIAVIIAVANYIANTTDVAQSAFGVICGAVAVAGAFIYNNAIGLINAIIQAVWTVVDPILGVIEWILNVMKGGFDSFGAAVANLLGQICSWFLSLGKIVTKIIDAIFGTNWTAGLEALQSSVISWGKNENAITLDRNAPTFGNRIEYGAAFQAGANWGDSVANKVSSAFNKKTGNDSQYQAGTYDYTGAGTGAGSDSGKTAANTGQTAANTAAIANSLDISNEQLKYLRDIAERDTVNRFTTAKIKVDMTNHNNVNSGMDLDGIVNGLTLAVEDAMSKTAEGVHI